MSDITGGNNAYLTKRRLGSGGVVQFSRDPLNLVNKHSRKYEGFVNDKAIGIQPDSNTVALKTKVHPSPPLPNILHSTQSVELIRMDWNR